MSLGFEFGIQDRRTPTRKSRKVAREEVERSVAILRSVLAYREVHERQRHD